MIHSCVTDISASDEATQGAKKGISNQHKMVLYETSPTICLSALGLLSSAQRFWTFKQSLRALRRQR